MAIGNQVVTNVIANVANFAGMPLLGQSFLSRLSSWSIDNDRHVLVLGGASSVGPSQFDGMWVADVPPQGNCLFPSRITLQLRNGVITGRVTVVSYDYPIRGIINESGDGRIIINNSTENSGMIRFSQRSFAADYMNATCGSRHAVGVRE
jgi:hypothetical protein